MLQASERKMIHPKYWEEEAKLDALIARKNEKTAFTTVFMTAIGTLY